MPQQKIIEFFDQIAESYDQQWDKLSALPEAMYLLMTGLLMDLAADAQVLCVGAGTGTEVLHFAHVFPNWKFTVVEPSQKMSAVCQQRVTEHGLEDRCSFHTGFLDTLEHSSSYDLATCLLVSHFLTNQAERAEFFISIQQALNPQGMLVSADLSWDPSTEDYQEMLSMWMNVFASGDVPDEKREMMRQSYEQDVSFLGPESMKQMLLESGFHSVVPFYQAGFIHAWYSRKSPSSH